MAPPERSSRARRWLVRLGILLAVVGVIVAAVRFWPKKALPVRAVHPQSGTVRDVVSSSVAGEVIPELHATVRADLAARVIAVLHRTGDRVKQGEVIIRLDAADLEARLSQAQAAAQAVNSQVAQSEARLNTLGRQAERARMLLARGAGTAQLSEDAESSVQEAQKALQAMRGQLQQSQAAVNVARVARAHAEITAPFTGLLTDVLPNVGEVLPPAAPVFQIIDDSRLHVDATIDEADAAKVRPGQEAELKLDALPDQAIKGRVARVDPAVKRDLKGARTLGVEVEVRDVDQARHKGLKPGMSANVEIVVAEKQGVVYLPSNVIIGRGVTRAVLALRPEGRHHRAQRVEVKVGISNWDRTEIASGVVPEDLVAASLNQKGVEDGALLQVEEQKGAAP